MSVVRWLLWSPGRAVGAGIALVLVVAILLMLGAYARDWARYRQELAAFEAAGSGDPAAADADGELLDFTIAGPGSPDSGSSAEATSAADDAQLAGSQEAREAATARAQEFVTLWLAGPQYADQASWVADLEPLVSAGVLPYLEVTPREELPDVELAGTRTVEVGPFSGTVSFELSDGSAIEVVLVLDAGADGWLVTDYREVPV